MLAKDTLVSPKLLLFPSTLLLAVGTEKEHAKELRHKTPFPKRPFPDALGVWKKEHDDRSLHSVPGPCSQMRPFHLHSPKREAPRNFDTKTPLSGNAFLNTRIKFLLIQHQHDNQQTWGVKAEHFQRPAVLKILRVVNLLGVVFLLSPCDLLSRRTLCGHHLPGNYRHFPFPGRVLGVVTLGRVVKTLRRSNSLFLLSS